MSAQSDYFSGLAELKDLVAEKEHAGLVVAHLNVLDYAGMVLYIGIYFNTSKSLYLLNLEWMSLGLDLYGDTLQESYSYRFADLEALTDHLHSKYGIAVSDIFKTYQFDTDAFPNPIRDEARKPEFTEAWERFQEDFKRGSFRDQSQQLHK